jgi:hypothetical protein
MSNEQCPHRAAPRLCSIENAGGEGNCCHPFTSASFTIPSPAETTLHCVIDTEFTANCQSEPEIDDLYAA